MNPGWNAAARPALSQMLSEPVGAALWDHSDL